MGFSKNLKKAFVKPIKAIDNKVIPIVNKINTHLDAWFPQEKYNWRKIAIGWAAIQAVVITALEIYVTLKNNDKIEQIYNFHKGSNDSTKLSLLSGTDSLAVYHMIFIVAQFFQLYLICDTITKSSTLQLIPGTIFSLGMGVYSIVQYIQANRGIKNEKLVQEYLEQKRDKLSDLRKGKWAEIVIIILMGIFCFGWIIITLRLYKNFGWNVFKQLGADIGVKNRLKLYQILLALLKIDIFFFTAFTIQFAIFVITNIKDGITIKIINIILLGLNFIMPFIGFIATKKENYVYMTLFIVLLSISLGYMVFNLFDILVDIHKNNNCNKNGEICERTYRDCSVSLSMACISSIIVGIITFVLALINFKNFPKGLKKDKTKRMLPLIL
ncbi:hypothetical protein PIROE2DRAFT_2748 [Piromyces sp. E2]|nr:hypothetical protein PIROE2DRAFT_2748 [Piromyces sp. E2]|eukprot:OUM69256.1 hypothetical protein PIROE2DRAFT_2748 [Piromyces sp. E2]